MKIDSKIIRLGFILIAFVYLLPVESTYADTVEIPASAYSASNNVTNPGNIFSLDTNYSVSHDLNYLYLRFPSANIPDLATVTKIQLKLYGNSSGNSGQHYIDPGYSFYYCDTPSPRFTLENNISYYEFTNSNCPLWSFISSTTALNSGAFHIDLLNDTGIFNTDLAAMVITYVPPPTPTPTPIPNSTITGTVYVDSNQNGVLDNGERGYGGVTITLDSGQSTTTKTDGTYTFSNIPNGTYTETISIPNGYKAITTNPVSLAVSGDLTQNFGIVAIPKTPIIIIPGIMGSEFTVNQTFDPGITNCLNPFSRYTYTQGDIVWLNHNHDIDYKLCGNYLDVLKLQADGQTPAYSQVELSQSLVSDTDPFGNNIGYHDILSYFEDKSLGKPGYTLNKDLFIFPYDWRKDISSNISALDNLINQITTNTDTNKVQIIAHSMGGLLARDYISDRMRANKVETLIELGTPHVGSPVVLAYLLYNKCYEWHIGSFSTCDVNDNEIHALVQNYPGFFELLPSQKYYQLYSNRKDYPFSDDRDIDNNSVQGALNYDQMYNRQQSLLFNLGKNMTFIDTAKKYHDLIDPLTTDANGKINGVTDFIIAGSGIPTIGQIHDYTGFTLFNNRVQAPTGNKLDADPIDGDDTVPTFSATLNQQNNVYYVQQRHGDLPTSNALQLTFNLLKGKTDLNAFPVPGVQTTPFSYSGQIISVHSPVNLNAYDDVGNHTGPTESGNVEENIPGSTYDTLGEAKFIYLPLGGHYHIATTATDQGSFDLKLKSYTNETLTNEQLFLAVAQTAKTTTTMNLDTPAPILHVDTNGDGTVIQDISPTSSLSGSALSDSKQPITSIQQTGTLGSDGWYKSSVSVTLSAQDSDSGVLNTYYYEYSEQSPHIYTNSINFDKEGITKLRYFSVDKAGNAEQPKEATIKIDKTAPEITVKFNPLSQQLNATGLDTGSGIASTNQTNTTMNTQDKAGNTTQLSIVTNSGALTPKTGILSLTIKGLRYNNQPQISLQATTVDAWTLGSNNLLTHLIQTYTIKGQEGAVSVYNDNQNKSTVITKTIGQKVDKSTNSGLTIIKLQSNQGKLQLLY